MIKWWWMGRTGHVARMDKIRKVYKSLLGSPKYRDHLENLGTDERIILKWILRKYDLHGLDIPSS
jgi:hypothetical protein